MRIFVLVLSFIFFPFGLAGTCSAISASHSGAARDVPGDGLQSAQTVVASYAGFERDNRCHWGDEDRLDGADPSCKTCDDGKAHNHWICDDGIVLRPVAGTKQRELWRATAEAVTPAEEFWASFLMFILGILGLFWLFRTRD